MRVTSDTGPFSIVPEWVIDAPISDRALRLYAVLARHADNGGRAIPGRSRLAQRLRCSVKSVDRALDDLRKAGAVVVHARYDEAGDRTTNEYIVSRVSPGRDTGVPTPRDTGVATPRDTGVPQNENQGEREPGQRDLAPLAREYDPLRGEKIDGRNLPWDALVEVTNADVKAESGRIARALKTIRILVVDAHATQAFDDQRGEILIASQIRARARLYRERWPTMELTPTALAKNWSRVAGPMPGRDPDAALRAAQAGIDAVRGDAA